MRSVRAVMLGAVILFGLAAPASAQRARLATFSISYVANVRGVDAGVVEYAFHFSNDAYEATSSRRLTGLVRTLMGAQQDFDYAARGQVGADALLHPLAYQHRDIGGRRRLVRVMFNGAEVTTVADPPMSMGHPPATPAQRAGSIDQVSMLGQMLLASGDPCRQNYRVLMDGRTRFDLALTPNGRQRIELAGYRGDAIRCAVEFSPVAGFSHPQTSERLTFLFAPVRGYLVPISIEMPTEEVGVIRLHAARFSLA